MEASFLTTILTFPPVILTILLGIILIYWIFVLLGALDIDVWGDISEGENMGDFLVAAGLAEIPFTIVISLWVLCSWVLTTVATYYLMFPLSSELAQFAMGLGIFVVGIAIALFMTTLLVKPLRPLFVTHEIHAQDKLVGKVCVVSTLRVDENFGQAAYDDKGAGLILAVRAQTPNRLTKGAKALIISYHSNDNTYFVTSYDEIISKS